MPDIHKLPTLEGEDALHHRFLSWLCPTCQKTTRNEITGRGAVGSTPALLSVMCTTCHNLYSISLIRHAEHEVEH